MKVFSKMVEQVVTHGLWRGFTVDHGLKTVEVSYLYFTDDSSVFCDTHPDAKNHHYGQLCYALKLC